MKPFIAPMSFMLHNALIGTYPLYEINFPNTLFSRGPLPGALNSVAVSTIPGKIEFTWNNYSDGTNAMDDDKVLLVVYNPTKQHAITMGGGNTRVNDSQTFPLPATFAGDEVQCYISCQNAKQSAFQTANG